MKYSYPFLFYFFYHAAAVFIQPNIVLYFQKSGFDGVQIGLLVGLVPLIIMLSAPLWTGLADASNRHKRIMSITILLAIVMSAIFPLAKSFVMMIPLVVLYALFAAPVVPFADSATMNMLANQKEMYGRVRLGGTFGWGLLALLAGPLVGKFGLRWAFWGYSIIMIFTLLTSLKFSYSQKLSHASRSGNVRSVLQDKRWAIFLALAFVAGIAFTVINSFLFPYMDELNIRGTYRGLALTIATISELPILFFANHLLKRFKAHGLLVLALLISGLRLLLYASINSSTGILAFQVLNGMTYPLFLIAGVAYANEISPEGMKSTAQGLYGSMLSGFGAATGGLASGLLMDRLGGQGLYFSAGMFVLFSLSIILLFERNQPARRVKTLD
ncbi:MAG TPA: MFS transporter [Anaerolineales bacterium]|nr:MFS transporter [Anaerolineales bacterium]